LFRLPVSKDLSSSSFDCRFASTKVIAAVNACRISIRRLYSHSCSCQIIRQTITQMKVVANRNAPQVEYVKSIVSWFLFRNFLVCRSQVLWCSKQRSSNITRFGQNRTGGDADIDNKFYQTHCRNGTRNEHSDLKTRQRCEPVSVCHGAMNCYNELVNYFKQDS
jgi:hypothetical protein